MVLVDCVGNPVLRLAKAGLDYSDLTDLIITHFHPDHASGVSTLLMVMWLLGRTKPLMIHGLGETLESIQKLMNLHGWEEWPNYFDVIFNCIQEKEMEHVIDCEDFQVFSSPAEHFVPNIGLRIEKLNDSKIVTYSCDTAPCRQVINLAENADILIHEATGKGFGHSSAKEAGVIAEEAGVKSLYLIHYPTWEIDHDLSELITEAETTFSGPVTLARDFMILN